MCVKYIYFTLCFALAAKGHKDCVELLVSSNAPLNGKDKVNEKRYCSMIVLIFKMLGVWKKSN